MNTTILSPFQVYDKISFLFRLLFSAVCSLHEKVARERYKGKARCVFMYETETINFFLAFFFPFFIYLRIDKLYFHVSYNNALSTK